MFKYIIRLYSFFLVPFQPNIWKTKYKYKVNLDFSIFIHRSFNKNIAHAVYARL